MRQISQLPAMLFLQKRIHSLTNAAANQETTYSCSLSQDSSSGRWHRCPSSDLLPHGSHPNIVLLCSCRRCLSHILHNGGTRRDTRCVALIAHFPHIFRFLGYIHTPLRPSYSCFRCHRISSFATCRSFRTPGLSFFIHYTG